MSFNLLFILTFTVLSYTYLIWGFKNLQREDMQVAATIPVRKSIGSEQWEGINFIWYGVLIANATAISIALFFILTVGADIPVSASAIIIAAILAVSMPASKIIARVVEKKSSTFTTGGAFFAGFLMTPVAIFIVNEIFGKYTNHTVPVMTVLAAMAITYATGEGLGRLACISFGCCYGKPLNACSPFVQRIFSRFNFVFTGKTKKISYAHGWDGLKIIPVQGITSVINLSIACVGMFLYVNSHFTAAFLIALILSQGWRILSEFIRSDYRGDKKISWYQIMCAASILFAVIISCLTTEPALVRIDTYAGIESVQKTVS
ncbi:MAG: prolipoprotein diacylglyceryl transferase [Nitrospirae bacterium]|nr:prolipoprotein diacylglyceryl transferase [Nitrospirota bacterium]